MSAPGRLLAAVLASAAAHGAMLAGLLAADRPPRRATVTSVRLVELAFDRMPAASGEGPAPMHPPGGPPFPPSPERTPEKTSGTSARSTSPRGETSGTFARSTFARTFARSEAAGTPASDGEDGSAAPGKEDGARQGAQGEHGLASTVRQGDGQGGGVDPRLAELHRRLAEAAARCYPPAAQRLRLQGEVPLRFCLDAHGGASGLSLLGTTGSDLLDRSALECVVPGAEPLPALAGCFQVAVRFGG